MLCPNCNSKLPDDSEFCQYCGVNILAIKAQKAALTSKAHSANLSATDGTGSAARTSSYVAVPPSDIQNCNSTHKKNKLLVALLITVLVLLLGSILLNIYQYSNNSGPSLVYRGINDFSYGAKYSDYYAGTEAMIVRVGETKTFKVTFNVKKEAEVSCQSNNACSTAEWGNNWDQNETCDFIVTGNTVGTTVYTFTNDYNSHSFKVLVIVMPKE